MQFETCKDVINQPGGTNTKALSDSLQATTTCWWVKEDMVSNIQELREGGMPTHCTPSCLRHPCAKVAWQLCGSCNIVLYAMKQLAHTPQKRVL